MANPNVSALTTLQYDRDKGALTTTTATIVAEVATGNVQIVESIILAGLAVGSFMTTINHGTTAIFSSIQVTGLTSEIIGGIGAPVAVLKEGDYMTGKTSANSSVNYLINKRVIT